MIFKEYLQNAGDFASLNLDIKNKFVTGLNKFVRLNKFVTRFILLIIFLESRLFQLNEQKRFCSPHLHK